MGKGGVELQKNNHVLLQDLFQITLSHPGYKINLSLNDHIPDPTQDPGNQ
jgi:hypothetical protein